jgi:tRNA threonylcarbamoyladenosine biosynthesis protein TsaE
LQAYQSSSVEKTKEQAALIAKRLKPGAVLAFFGDLGTGKTTFIRYLAEEVAGIAPEMVSSPTFQYLNIYQGHIPVYHFDLYRLRNEQDFLHLGFDEMLQGSGVCCIEWAERIESLLPKETIRICMTHVEEEKRLIAIQEGL